MVLLVLYVIVMIAALALGCVLGGLHKSIATLSASLLCLLLVTGGILVNRPAWVPDWLINDWTSLLQGSWYAPLGIALLVLALRRMYAIARERQQSAPPVLRTIYIIVILFFVLGGAGFADLRSRIYGPEWTLAETRTRRPHIEGEMVFQNTVYTCGPAACATLLRLSGAAPNATEAELIPLCHIQFHAGATVLSLAAAVKERTQKMGWTTRLLEPTPFELEGLALPALVSVKQGPYTGHVVVLCERQQRRVRVADPDGGMSWWKREDFAKRYLGEAITLTR